jgi:hypothetical protein
VTADRGIRRAHVEKKLSGTSTALLYGGGSSGFRLPRGRQGAVRGDLRLSVRLTVRADLECKGTGRALFPWQPQARVRSELFRGGQASPRDPLVLPLRGMCAQACEAQPAISPHGPLPVWPSGGRLHERFTCFESLPCSVLDLPGPFDTGTLSPSACNSA